jgi:hypothetical protein
MVGLDDQLPRLVEKNLSLSGQGHATFIPQKERHAKAFLELANLPAERRLRDVQLLRSLAEVEALRDRNKVANVT